MSDARRIVKVSGTDAEKFLQDLVTNDISKADAGLVYAALLTAQGKFFADFFVLKTGDHFLVDLADATADSVIMRLNMYRLRAKVMLEEVPLFAHRGIGEIPEDGFTDPRDASLGWRAYRDHSQNAGDIDWTARRVAALVPESGAEIGPDSYILEMGFERLNGVDFRKGCYVGQEVTARMKHKTELRKGLARVTVEGEAEAGTPIVSGGKPAGTLHSRSGDKALAYLRFDRATDEMTAGDAKITLDKRP